MKVWATLQASAYCLILPLPYSTWRVSWIYVKIKVIKMYQVGMGRREYFLCLSPDSLGFMLQSCMDHFMKMNIFLNLIHHWQALLHSVPFGKMIVLDLFAEVKPIWKSSSQFYNTPYIWHVTHSIYFLSFTWTELYHNIFLIFLPFINFLHA